MYSRDFGGGIQSEGNLYDYINKPQPNAEEHCDATMQQQSCETAHTEQEKSASGGMLSGIKKTLSGLHTDDLILLAIGVLLLLDSDTDNDILIILIVALLLL